jgi:hypothetical protein
VAFRTAVEIVYKPAIILLGFWKHFIFSGHALDEAVSGYGQVASTCECSNEPSSSIIRRGFLD